MSFRIKKGDRLPSLPARLDPDGQVVDFNDATAINFVYRKKGTLQRIVKTAAWTNQPNGLAIYDWEADDTDEVGKYEAQFEVTFTDKVMTFPTVNFIEFEVTATI